MTLCENDKGIWVEVEGTPAAGVLLTVVEGGVVFHDLWGSGDPGALRMLVMRAKEIAEASGGLLSVQASSESSLRLLEFYIGLGFRLEYLMLRFAP